MARLYQDKLDRIAEMAGRADGVSNKDIQSTFGCCVKIAAVLIFRAGLQVGFTRIKLPRRRLRLFTDTHTARTWEAKQLACAEAAVRALDRTRRDREEAAAAAATQKASQRKADAEQRFAARRQAAQAMAEQKAAERKAARAQAAKDAQALARVASRNRPKSGTFNGGPTVRPAEPAPRPLTAAQQFAAATPVITPNTKFTTCGAKAEPRRINRMADPLPGVPGWATGPAIRPGALDYKRHQHHGALAVLTGKGGA